MLVTGYYELQFIRTKTFKTMLNVFGVLFGKLRPKEQFAPIEKRAW